MTDQTELEVFKEDFQVEEKPQGLWGYIKRIFSFFWDIIRNVAFAIRATIYLFVNTLPVLLPSVVNSSSADEEYNRWLSKSMGKLADILPELTDLQRHVLRENWLSQMDWVENRATRERNANELIRWWQIILGVLIPVFIQVEWQALASIAGVFVAVITAVHQFRRPDDRWRHYRMLAERYKMEFWSYVTLSGEEYEGKTHAEVFEDFNQRMNELRRDDLVKFFGQVVPPDEGRVAQLQMERLQRYLKSQGLVTTLVPEEEEDSDGDSAGG